MSKIYEALQLEHRKRTQQEPERDQIIHTLPAAHSVPAAHSPARQFHAGLESEMLGLYYAIESDLSEQKSPILQFVSTQEGEGTSTIVHEFGRVVASELGKSVLLFEADQRTRLGIPGFARREQPDLEMMLKNNARPEEVFHRVDELRFFVCPVTNNGTSPLLILNSPQLDPFFERLKSHFDLILIDSPSLGLSPYGLAVCKKADGVILVVEAERSRWPVVQSGKNRIEKAGGKILGVVLNKRRYHIPKHLYNYI